MSSIEIRKISITELDTDAIVNAANEGLWAGGGVCGAIFRAAGYEQLQDACDAIGHCDTGSAVITPGFNLKAKYIIHAVGPRWSGGSHGEPELLYSAYYKSLQLALENGCRSIGFPLISAGIFGYPLQGAWQTAVRACGDFLDHLTDQSLDIIFAVLSDEIIEAGRIALKASGAYRYKVADRSDWKNVDMPEQHAASAKPISGRDARQARIEIFNDTFQKCKTDPDLVAAIAASKKRTQVFYENQYPVFHSEMDYKTEIIVSKKRSYQAAMDLKKEQPDAKVAVLNFANAFHPGGGVKSGASAQEESLCRCSTLYPLLCRKYLKGKFYDHHSKLSDPKATDTVIYTEDVVVFKTDTALPEMMDKADWVSVDVMTCAAPDLRKKSNMYAALVGNGTFMNDAELFGYHVRRAIHLLTVAAAKGADTLVLGAFGCGAFENDPAVVARAYRTALQEFVGVFRRIEFAIYSPPGDEANYNAFSKELT